MNWRKISISAAGEEAGAPTGGVSRVFPGGGMCGNLKARFEKNKSVLQ